MDFKSDKERIANSTRKGMKAQKAMLAEMRKGNAAQGVAPTELNRWGVSSATARPPLPTGRGLVAARPQVYGPRMAYLVAGAGSLVAVVAATWTSRRTDALRRVDPKAAQRIDEARAHLF